MSLVSNNMKENSYTKMIKDYECSGDAFFPSYGVKHSDSNSDGSKESKKSLASKVLKFDIGELKVSDIGELGKYIPGYVQQAGSVKLGLSYEPLADGRGQGEHVNRIYSLDKDNKFVIQAWADNSQEVRETLDDMKHNLVSFFSDKYSVKFDNPSEATISRQEQVQTELEF